MADRKISLNELAEKVGITNVNLSKLKTGKVTMEEFSGIAEMLGSPRWSSSARPWTASPGT